MRYQQITSDERCNLATLRKQHYSKAAIARIMGRHPSTITRELRRNCCPYDGGYRHLRAQDISDLRRRRSRRKSLLSDQDWLLIEESIKADFSPEQVSGTFRLDRLLRVSHETIYKHIWHDKRRGGTLPTLATKTKVPKALRTLRKTRQSGRKTTHFSATGRGRTPSRVRALGDGYRWE